MRLAVDRRQFIGSASLGAGILLTGCATVAGRPARAGACLPPVHASPDRIIRTMAGLRPYREAGFVVREERLGSKRLVHNYGHGGAGITLSWGSSRLAADLGLAGHQGPVAVIGAGIMGLTTARLVQEAGFPVTLYAAALPPDTTSNVAGGQWSPFGHYRESRVTDAWRAQFATALDYSWRRFQIMVGEDYGIRWLTNFAQGSPPSPAMRPYHPAFRQLEPGDHPFPVDRLVSFRTLFVEPGRFLRQLIRDIQIAGGRIQVRRFATKAELASLPESLVFNCTGLGARDLFGDTELQPVRGQLAILLPQPEIDYAFTGEAGYMFPRPDGIVLGGTFERGIWSTTPEPEAIGGIVRSHQRLFAGFRCLA